jgi:hypothetical protein
VNAPSIHRLCADLGVPLTPYARRALAAETPAPALPRLPADLLRECAEAARIATTHNPEE